MITAVKYLECICYGLFFTLPLWGIALSNDKVVETELRPAAMWPEKPTHIRSLSQWPKQVEAYVNDHFSGRAGLIELSSRIQRPLGSSISSEVAIGREGWLFLKRDRDVYNKHTGRQPYADRDVQSWLNDYRSWKSTLEAAECKVYYSIIPNKHTIHQEHLPSGWDVYGTPFSEAIATRLIAEDENYVDLFGLFRSEAARSDFSLYQKLDTHWTATTSYHAYSNILQRVQADSPSLIIPARRPMALQEKGGDLARMIGLDGVLLEANWWPSSTTEFPSFKEFMRDGYTSAGDALNSGSVLIYCDSFVYSFLTPYIVETWGEVRMYHHDALAQWEEHVAVEQPRVILLLQVERLVPDCFLGCL